MLRNKLSLNLILSVFLLSALLTWYNFRNRELAPREALTVIGALASYESIYCDRYGKLPVFVEPDDLESLSSYAGFNLSPYIKYYRPGEGEFFFSLSNRTLSADESATSLTLISGAKQNREYYTYGVCEYKGTESSIVKILDRSNQSMDSFRPEKR